jgi:hypothetical protein
VGAEVLVMGWKYALTAARSAVSPTMCLILSASRFAGRLGSLLVRASISVSQDGVIV